MTNPTPPRPASPDREALREGIARVIDPEAWIEFDEELHNLEHELEAAGMEAAPNSLQLLALDNVNSRRFRRERSLRTATAIEAILPLPPVPSDKKTMCLTLSDAEVDALEKLSAQKDLSPEGIYRSALRIYQLIAMGHSRLVDVEPDTRLAPPVPSEEQVEAALAAYQKVMFAHALNVNVTGEAMTGKEARLQEAIFKGRQKEAMRAALSCLSPINPPTGEGEKDADPS